MARVQIAKQATIDLAHEMYQDKPDLLRIMSLGRQGADVNVKGRLGWTALMYAAIYCCSACVYTLLKHKADVNLKDDNSKTALDHASNKAIKQILLDAGVKR